MSSYCPALRRGFETLLTPPETVNSGTFDRHCRLDSPPHGIRLRPESRTPRPDVTSYKWDRVRTYIQTRKLAPSFCLPRHHPIKFPFVRDTINPRPYLRVGFDTSFARNMLFVSYAGKFTSYSVTLVFL